MDKIKWITQAIAQPSHIQKSLFPDFVNVADQLAVEWEVAFNESEQMKAELTEQQISMIKRLDDYMDSISGADNIRYWSNDTLSQSSEWDNMRRMAEAVLTVMGWDNAVPPKDGDVYVIGDAIYINN